MIRRPPRSTPFPTRRSSDLSVTDCKHVTAEFVSNGIPVASIKEVQSRFVDLTHANQTTDRSEEHTSELQSLAYLVCRLLLEKKKNKRLRPRSKHTVMYKLTI